jgi:hypothetical protein
MHLPYLAAHQLVNRLSNEQFEIDAKPVDPKPIDVEPVAPSRMDSVRAGVADLLRRTADRVEPARF